MAENTETVVVPPAQEAVDTSEVVDTAFAVGTEEAAASRTFTEDDVEKIRQQEKDKLYKRLDESDALSRREDEEMSAKELITKR